MKLTEQAVKEIREVVQQRNQVRYQLSNKMIARRFNVSVQAIRNVIKRKRWAWVK